MGLLCVTEFLHSEVTPLEWRYLQDQLLSFTWSPSLIGHPLTLPVAAFLWNGPNHFARLCQKKPRVCCDKVLSVAAEKSFTHEIISLSNSVAESERGRFRSLRQWEWEWERERAYLRTRERERARIASSVREREHTLYFGWAVSLEFGFVRLQHKCKLSGWAGWAFERGRVAGPICAGLASSTILIHNSFPMSELS